MNPTQSTVPVRMSNEEFQSGAIYGGGRGIVRAAQFKYHDYNGKHPKDSFTGFFITLQPTDGSNGGKEAELFWNVGPATEIIPDMDSKGGSCLGLHGKTQISDNSNYSKYFYSKATTTCGMEKGRLSGQSGVHALEGSEIGFAQIDQDQRDFADNQPGQAPGQKQQARKVLVPTFAKWAWEGGVARPVAQMPNPTAQVAPAGAPAHTNGTAPSGISVDLANILKSIGTVDLSSNPAKSVLDFCVANNINNPARMPIVKEATALFKDAANLEVLAAANGWTVSGGILMAG